MTIRAGTKKSRGKAICQNKQCQRIFTPDGRGQTPRLCKECTKQDRYNQVLYSAYLKREKKIAEKTQTIAEASFK